MPVAADGTLSRDRGAGRGRPWPRGPEAFNALRAEMKHTCNTCHSKGFINAHFDASDEIINAADHEFAKAIAAVQGRLPRQ